MPSRYAASKQLRLGEIRDRNLGQLRVQRSNAREESAGLRAQVESAALQLRQLQKAHDGLQAQQVATREPGGESEE